MELTHSYYLAISCPAVPNRLSRGGLQVVLNMRKCAFEFNSKHTFKGNDVMYYNVTITGPAKISTPAGCERLKIFFSNLTLSMLELLIAHAL